MSLTVTKINSLRPKLKRYTASDGRGLFLDITPNGAMSWVFRYRLNGEQEKVIIGPYPVLGLKDAREKRGALAGKVASGISPVEEKRKLRADATAKSAGELTVREFGECYLNEQVDKNWKDPSNERRYIEKDFFPDFGERALKDISVVDIQTVTYRKRDNVHSASALRLRSAIKRMYDYAVEQRLTMITPATMVANRCHRSNIAMEGGHTASAGWAPRYPSSGEMCGPSRWTNGMHAATRG